MRRVTSTTIAVALALTFGVATRASAQACTPAAANAGPFSIDGCVVPASNSKLAGDATPVVDPNGSTKELGPINASTTKLGVINTAPTPMLGPTNPNAQVDLNTAYTQTGADPITGHIWFYFGWVRDSNNGSGFVSIELQKTGVPTACTGTDGYSASSCNPWSGRAAGDILILWDQQGSSTAISIRTYNGTAFGAPVLLDPANGTVKARYSTDFSRGEVAIDFTAEVFPKDGSCTSFANTIPGTVTGNSDSADYKDAVLSPFEPVSNCGKVKVIKATDPTGKTGPAGGFAYTLSRVGGEQVRFDGTPSISDTLSGHGDSDTFLDLVNATNYKLVEAAQTAPWAYVSTSCVLKLSSGDVSAGSAATGFTVQGGVTTECTITNKLETGTITVIKHVINDNGGSAAAGDFTMFLGTGNPSFSGSETGVTTTLNAGTAFAVTESNLNSYTGTVGTGAGDTCSGTMAAGATYVCHVTNDDKPAHLIIIKNVINNNGLSKGASDFSGTITGVTAVGGNTWTGTATPGVDKTLSTVGTYNVTENTATGYTTTYSTDCKNTTIALGETKTCTVTNDDNPASPSGTTSQKVLLHDSISIPGIRNGAGTTQTNATATFRLYTNDQCTAPVLVGGNPYAEVVTLSYGSVVNGVTSGSAATSVGVTVLQPKTATTFYWRVEYSGDSFNSTFTTACGIETTTLAIQ